MIDGKNLYLATYDLHIAYYRHEDRPIIRENLTKLIWAVDEEEAAKKLELSHPNEEQSVYYIIQNSTISEAL